MDYIVAAYIFCGTINVILCGDELMTNPDPLDRFWTSIWYALLWPVFLVGWILEECGIIERHDE